MKSLTINHIFKIILICLYLYVPVLSQTTKEAKFTVSSGDMIDVFLRHGNINITTRSGSEVTVVGKNLDESERDLFTIEQKTGKLVIKFEGEDSDDFELDLTIPSTVNLDLSTGGGKINVEGDLSGTIDASTGGGDITAGNINGKTDFSTAGGNVTVGNINNEAVLSSAGGDMNAGVINGNANFSTAGGNISIISINKSAEVSTAGGNINIGDIGGTANISTAGGNINVGVVSGRADISTAGGNINLDGATGKVEANTGAGNVNLKNIKGSIDASTGAGNITVELYPDGTNNSELSSGVGNITLYVPENSKATIVASINEFHWGESEEAPDNLNSDFEITTINKRGHGKSTEATYQLNGGGSVIELNASMGEINIRKLK